MKPVYLFIGGLGAGAGIVMILYHWIDTREICPCGCLCLIIGLSYLIFGVIEA